MCGSENPSSQGSMIHVHMRYVYGSLYKYIYIYTHTHTYIHIIYIYIYRERERETQRDIHVHLMLRRTFSPQKPVSRHRSGHSSGFRACTVQNAASFRTKILHFRGLDSIIIIIILIIIFSLRGGILIPLGNFPEILSQGIVVGTILAGRLGVTKRSSS